MRGLVFIIAALIALMLGGVKETAQAEKSQVQKRERCLQAHQGINFYRHATHKWQQKMGHPITKSSKQPIRACDYARWVARLWMKRAHAWRVKYDKWHAEVLRYQAWLRSMSDPVNAIRHVFGSYASQAIAVARCESGLYTGAVNGQYLGLFQMGESERATYGHGGTALDQAMAAYRYFTSSGKDWSPWECKPW